MLASININDFRNIKEVQLEFNSGCNFFYGKNGSGKTSFLEAIHYLVLGRSFRTHLIRRLINYNSKQFAIFGKFFSFPTMVTAGISRSIKEGKKIKISGQESNSLIEITKLSPLQLLNYNSYLFLYSSSKIRRQFIDQGLFHVEHQFLNLWQKVERIIKQRNAALRNHATKKHIISWNQPLSIYGNELHEYRKSYISKLIPIVNEILNNFLGDYSIKISYFPGWNMEHSLAENLIKSLTTDLQVGYTTLGPHRADLQILVDNIPAKDILSRGQQKLLLYGLQIAQSKLLNNLTDKKSIYLIDDVLAELDVKKAQVLVDYLLKLKNVQLFITALAQTELESIFDSQQCWYKSFLLDKGDIIEKRSAKLS